MESQLWSPYNEAPPRHILSAKNQTSPLGTQIPWPTDFTYTICSMFWKHIKACVSGYIKRRSTWTLRRATSTNEKLRRGHKAFVPGHALPWFYTLCTCVTVQPYTLPAISAATIEDSPRQIQASVPHPFAMDHGVTTQPSNMISA